MEIRNYARKIEDLSEEIGKALVEFVNSKGGKIDTSNDEDNDTLFAFVWDEANGTFCEKKVVEVGVGYNNSLYVKVDEPFDDDDVYPIFGGYVLVNATLYSICDILEEYVV
jgi:hypothetical protein